MSEQQDQLQDKRRQDFFIIDNAVIDDYNLTPFEFTVYAIIVRRAYNKTTAWPGMANIAKWGSMSKSTVIRAVNGLEEKGLLQVKRGKKEDGQNAANIYTIMETSRPQTPGSVRETLGVVSEIDQKNTEDKKTKEEDSNTTPSAKSADGEMGASENGNVNPSKKESPHTIMKNAILGAFGWDAAHVADWGVIDAASKKLRKVEFPPGELPALYAYCASKFDKFGPGCLASHVAAYYKEKNNHATTQSRIEQKYEVPASRQRTGERPLKRESRNVSSM